MKILQLFLGLAIAVSGTLAYGGRTPPDEETKAFLNQVDTALEGWADDDPFLRASNPFPPTTSAHQAYRRFLVRLLKTPEYQAFILERALERHAEDGSPDFAQLVQQVIGELAEGGVKRLDDSDLERYHEGTAKMLFSADDEACGQIARAGFANPTRAHTALVSMPRKLLDEWFSVRYRAVLASLREERSTALDPNDQTLALQAVFLQLQGDLRPTDLARVLAVLSDQDAATDAEVCSAVRHFYAAVSALPPDLKGWAYRVLVPE